MASQDGPIRAGDLREVVYLDQMTTSRDALNQPIKSWTPYATVRAKVDTIRGMNVHLANQYKEPTTLEVTIRTGPPITKLWRIRWDDEITGTTRTLAIQDILPLRTRDGMILLCSEGLTSG